MRQAWRKPRKRSSMTSRAFLRVLNKWLPRRRAPVPCKTASTSLQRCGLLSCAWPLSSQMKARMPRQSTLLHGVDVQRAYCSPFKHRQNPRREACCSKGSASIQMHPRQGQCIMSWTRNCLVRHMRGQGVSTKGPGCHPAIGRAGHKLTAVGHLLSSTCLSGRMQHYLELRLHARLAATTSLLASERRIKKGRPIACSPSADAGSHLMWLPHCLRFVASLASSASFNTTLSQLAPCHAGAWCCSNSTDSCGRQAQT